MFHVKRYFKDFLKKFLRMFFRRIHCLSSAGHICLKLISCIFTTSDIDYQFHIMNKKAPCQAVFYGKWEHAGLLFAL